VTAGVLAAVCATAAGCSGGAALSAASLSGSPSAPGAEGTSAGDPPAMPGDHPSITMPTATSPAATSPASACVTRVYGAMTLAQRVGQLFLVGVPGDVAGPATLAAVRDYHFGSVLLPQDADGTVALAAAVASIQALAPSATAGARFLVAANQEGGAVQQLTGTGFATIPSALEQGTWAVSELRAQAATWGSDLHAAGVNLNLAPVMDVVPAATATENAPIGALDREFGYDPDGNGEHGAAFIAGMAQAGVATVAKHFPGLGRVTGNTDFTSNVIDDVTMADDPDLGSFRAAISAGVPFVMVALATYTRIDPARLAVFSPVVMRLLRSGLGFGGVIVSDDLGDAAAVTSTPVSARAIDFLDAGGDLITSQSIGPAQEMAAAAQAKASGSAAFRATVDAAARRVLAAKQADGLLSC
jgi:beta-N-acetylhexosaminidase